MNDILFDSRDEKYKKPFGAVTSGEEVTFTISVAEHLGASGAVIVMKYDRHDSPARYSMEGCLSSDDGYTGFSVTVPIHDTGLYWYYFEIEKPDGVIKAGRDVNNDPVITDSPSTWQQTVYSRKYEVPEWITGGAFYHIMVDRFCSSGNRIDLPGKVTRNDWGGTPYWKPVDGKILNNDFFGGDLEGIREKLPYLSDLGITCLYLSPIFEAYSNHKYDTGDYEKVDPMFGDEETLKALCRDAGELGIRVILDGVFSHTGSDSKYFDKYGHYGGHGAFDDPESPYRKWYYFHDDGTYDSWWDFDTLPKLNKEEPSYVDYITGENGIIRKWLRAGAAGWRLDVADELPVSFLTKLVASAKDEKPDSIIIGEVWEDASNKIAYDERKNYFEGERLDSVMNYPFRKGIIDFVRNGNAGSLAETVEITLEHYPKEVVDCLMNLLGTHDSIRIITALAGKDLGRDPSREEQADTRMDQDEWARGIEMLKMASLLQITLPGVPCVYYGDEAGTEGYKDPFNRTCYPWGYENKDLLSWYRTLLKIRKDRAIFRHGLYKTLEKDNGVFSFMRYDPEGKAKKMIVAVNAGDADAEITLDGTYHNVIDGGIKEGKLILGPSGAALLEEK